MEVLKKQGGLSKIKKGYFLAKKNKNTLLDF